MGGQLFGKLSGLNFGPLASYVFLSQAGHIICDQVTYVEYMIRHFFYLVTYYVTKLKNLQEILNFKYRF
ncbi:hypothetical protein BpHYR1_016300 [Brachionus plicatilis]|uniref:Uncharacterized protein n=1 Tax=Brachionus plicatilis TaxID=10195 RepID=A0A3M7QLF1_BRAPC|nr:hypothetical protein BpHYR1_016300 [Brachionus plicatilis]